MKRPTFFNPTASVLAAFGALLLVGCDAGSSAVGADGEYSAIDLDPILADPAVGDLWAAKLDEFSNDEFGDSSGEVEAAYGLMKVIAVTDDRVTVITESAAWPMASGTVDELRGDLSGITWDETEEIPINRADIPGLVESEYILETRRLAE